MEICRELMNWLLFGYWYYSSRKLPLTSNRCLNFRILPVNLQLQAFSSSNTRKRSPALQGGCYPWHDCLFLCGFSSHSRIFHSFGNVTIAGEGLQIWTYARHLWPLLSSEGSLACHTYCDTGHPFMMVISKDPWQSHLMPSV